MFCRHCGQRMPESARFCAACGASRILPAAAVRAPQSKRRRLRPWMVLPLVLLSLMLFSLLVWQAGNVTGIWQDLAWRRATSAWERYDDRGVIETEVMATLATMADSLEAGQMQAALSHVHPDHQERYRQDFADYPERIPVLVHGLRKAHLTFLSTELDAYDSDRMVRVTLELPDEAVDSQQPEARFFTLTLVLSDDRWVIDS